MRTLETKNGNVLVAGGKTDGVPRWAYFSADGKFIRYTSKNEWDEACKTWGVQMQKAEGKNFIFPSLSSWKPQSFKNTDAGKLIFFWRWRNGANRKVQQTSCYLNGIKILEKDDIGVMLTNEIKEKINLIASWQKDGFNFFSFSDAINFGLYGGGWFIPTNLISMCFSSAYEEKTVKRAIEFIGTEKPDKYKIERMNGLIEISYSMLVGGGTYWFYPNGNLECLRNSGSSDVYKGLLWIVLNSLKEEF